jgi:hypothetical protein
MYTLYSKMFLRPQACLSYSHPIQLRLLCLKNYIAEENSKRSGAQNTQNLLDVTNRYILLNPPPQKKKILTSHSHMGLLSQVSVYLFVDFDSTLASRSV